MVGITAVLSIMTHEYNTTRAKKDSAVTGESLQNLEDNIRKSINSVKDEVINLKETVNKRLQEDNEKLRDKCRKLENKLNTVETSLDALEQYGRRNNIVITGIPDSVQDTDLESTMTSILSDIDVIVESSEVEDCHRIGKSNVSKKTIIRFNNRKYCKQALLNRKRLETLNYSKHQFGSGRNVFINENLTIRNEQLAFNCRQLKRKNRYLLRLLKMVWHISSTMKTQDQCQLPTSPFFKRCFLSFMFYVIRIPKSVTVLIRAALLNL